MLFCKSALRALAVLLLCAAPAMAETGQSRAFMIGQGPGVQGFYSLICATAQIPIGQSGNPACGALSGDVTMTSNGTVSIGAGKVLNSMLATMAANTTKCNATGGTANPTDCTAATMRTNLGLVIGTNVQAWDADLDALAALSGTGIVRRTGTSAFSNGTAVLNAELATMTANTVKANATSGAATPTDLAVPSCSTASSALTWTTNTGFGCNTISGGGSGGSISSQTANYTITTGDCGNAIQAGTGGNTFFTITLPAITGFTAGCEVTIKNADTTRGKRLSGFPSDLSTILWPLQTARVKVNAAATAWIATQDPGRWQMPAQITFHVDVTNGSNSNDGLATGAGNALQTAQAAYNYIMNQADTQTTSPIIAMTCAQTHTAALQMGGVPLGTNLIQVSPDGNCTFTWSNSGACIIISDLAELDLRLNQYGSSGNATFACNTANSVQNGAIYLHNDVVLDLESGPAVLWTPGGTNDNLIFCDGMCQYTVGNGISQTGGTGNRYIWMAAGGHGTLSGPTTPVAGSNLSGMLMLFGGATLNLGTTGNTGWTSIGATNVWANSTIVTNGITPQGGYSIGASAAACSGVIGPTC